MQPTKEELKSTLNKYFGLSQVPQYLDDILGEIKSVLSKGKSITFSDLQDILQNTLERSNSQSIYLKVTDFSVSTSKDKRSIANVEVTAGGEEKDSSGEGVGPVDAVINALNKILKKKVDFKLSNYRVNIRDEGPNALVFVEIKLENKSGYSIGNSTSPDIIQASIEAYVNAFNDIV